MAKISVKNILQKVAESFTVAQILSLYGSIDGTWGRTIHREGIRTENWRGQKLASLSLK
jgi:hypothetical protein